MLGFLNPTTNKLSSYMTTGGVNSDLLIACFDNFITKINGKKTVVILDNTPTHKSIKFKKRIEEWKNQGLIIYFIPPYSPNLNKIEILWRFIKYNWFKIETYFSFKYLSSYIEEVLKTYVKNNQYVINFV